MTVVSTVIVPTNPADQKIILDALMEADKSLIRIAAEKDLVKTIVEDLTDKFPDISKKYFNKMIKTYHKQNFNEITEESEDFSDLYTTIVK